MTIMCNRTSFKQFLLSYNDIKISKVFFYWIFYHRCVYFFSDANFDSWSRLYNFLSDRDGYY